MRREGGVSLVCACVRVKHGVRKTSNERFFSRVRAKSCLFLVVLDWRVAEEVDKPERLRKFKDCARRQVRIEVHYSMIRSNSLREARRAGLPTQDTIQCEKRGVAPWAQGVCWVCLNTTISAFVVSAKQAQKMAILKGGGVGRKRGVNGSPQSVWWLELTRMFFQNDVEWR